MWVRKDVSQDYEILNYANRLYYEIIVFQKQPQEKHVHRAYQVICGEKLWENYTESKNVVFDEYAITIRPEKNFVEFYRDYMKDFVQKHSINYIKKENVKL